MKILLLLSLAFLSISNAGQDKGGGIVLVHKDKFYLWDLVEAGLEEQALINTGKIQRDPLGLEKELRIKLNAMKGSKDFNLLINATVNKFYELYDRNHYFAHMLFDYIIKEYKVLFLDFELVKTKDLGDSVIEPKKEISSYQVAVRSKNLRSISIDKTAFLRLKMSHRVGLLMHEYLGDLTSYNEYLRSFNAYLFSYEFQYSSAEDFSNLIANNPNGANIHWINIGNIDFNEIYYMPNKDYNFLIFPKSVKAFHTEYRLWQSFFKRTFENLESKFQNIPSTFFASKACYNERFSELVVFAPDVSKNAYISFNNLIRSLKSQNIRDETILTKILTNARYERVCTDRNSRNDVMLRLSFALFSKEQIGEILNFMKLYYKYEDSNFLNPNPFLFFNYPEIDENRFSQKAKVIEVQNHN